MFFVDVGPAHRDNRAILDARPSQTEMLAGDTVPLEVTVGNFSQDPFKDRVTVTLDKQFSVDQEISIAPWSEEKSLCRLLSADRACICARCACRRTRSNMTTIFF